MLGQEFANRIIFFHSWEKNWGLRKYGHRNGDRGRINLIFVRETMP